MSNFLINQNGEQIWYDLKSNTKKYEESVYINIEYPDQPTYYVRPHRDDGPAIITADGSEWYYIEGKLHRDHNPAIIWSDGDTSFLQHGKYHNENGPSKCWKKLNIIEFWIDGREYPFDDWCKLLDKSPEEINYIMLKFGL